MPRSTELAYCPEGDPEFMPAVTRWNFWLPDSDRTAGWTNHCYVLQFVCAGVGATPADAWESAKRSEVEDLGFPECFELPENLIAIREDAEHQIEVS